MRFSRERLIPMAAKVLTPKEIALEWGISAKTLRKFLRKDAKVITAVGGTNPGKGGRWSIPASQVKGLRTRFDAWVAANAKPVEEVTDEVIDEVEDEVNED